MGNALRAQSYDGNPDFQFQRAKFTSLLTGSGRNKQTYYLATDLKPGSFHLR